MAPRKKPEEKASGEEAADMILHYLRKAHLNLPRVTWSRWMLTVSRQTKPTVLSH
jgi:hypothetical protein